MWWGGGGGVGGSALLELTDAYALSLRGRRNRGSGWYGERGRGEKRGDPPPPISRLRRPRKL